MNTFEESFQSYFDEVCLIASLEFLETDIPSMIVKMTSKIANMISKNIKVTIYWSSDSVNTLIKTQEKHGITVHSRVLDGICR